jgi:O26-antigen biosynthesis N-acetyl-L-fucosamine transferase
MKVLLVVDNYFPSRKSAAKHFRDLAIGLRNSGHEPVVLTPSELIQSGCEISIEEGVEVIRFKSAKLKHPSLLVRALREARLSLVAWWRAGTFLKKRRFDLIVYYSPTLFWAPLIWRLKRLWNAPSYLVLRDIAPQWMLDTGVLRKGPAYLVLKAAELFQYKVSNVIAVQSDGDLAHFAGAPARTRDKLDVLYNWAPTDEGEIPARGHRDRLGLTNKTIFFYGGTFGEAQDMDSILRLAFALREEESVFFLLVGAGTQLSRMENRIAADRLSNIRILPSLDQMDYLALVSEIDVGMISLSAGLKTHNIPGKILGYAYHGKPILANLNPGIDLGRMLQEYNAGLVSEGNFEILESNARLLISDPSLRAAMGRNSRRLLEDKFSTDYAVGHILGRLKKGNS